MATQEQTAQALSLLKMASTAIGEAYNLIHGAASSSATESAEAPSLHESLTDPVQEKPHTYTAAELSLMENSKIQAIASGLGVTLQAVEEFESEGEWRAVAIDVIITAQSPATSA